jgi:PHP family Zn ribbon phosphoesterase
MNRNCEFPGNPSPVGKPSIKTRLAATSKGKLAIHTGHGKEYGQVSAERSFTGKSGTSNGATPKGGLTIRTGHGTEYGQTSSRG